MRKGLICLLFFCLGVISLFAAQKSGFVNLEALEKRELVKKLAAVTDLRSGLDYSINSMVQPLPLEIRDDVRKAISTDELMRRILPVYERHLSKEVLKAVLEFYGTPAGIEWLGAQKPLMEDSMAISKVYAEECVRKLQEKK